MRIVPPTRLLTARVEPQAVFSNPQIINPSYTFCNTLLLSKDVLSSGGRGRLHTTPLASYPAYCSQVLFEMMGKEEALDVMLKNPAVLQARLTETGRDWLRLAETGRDCRESRGGQIAPDP